MDSPDSNRPLGSLDELTGGTNLEDELNGINPGPEVEAAPPLSPLRVRNLTPAEIRDRLSQMRVRRGVVQDRSLPPVSPLLEPDDRNYPLPPEVPPLAAPTSGRPAPQPHIFHRILQHSHLVHCFTSQLEINDLVNLYSICKPLRAHCAARWTHMIKSWAMEHAPINWHIARFKWYSDLCRPDPGGKPLQDNQAKVREVPSFRYLRMIEFREKTARSIVRDLAKHGHRLPSMAKVILAKLWFVMDVPDNQTRAAIFHAHGAWSNAELFVAVMFIMKLEMRLTDPRSGGRSSVFRNMWMAQRGFAPLDQFLQRKRLTTEGDLVLEMAYWSMPQLPSRATEGFLGAPIAGLGRLVAEKWLPTQGRPSLMPVDVYVVRECVRRGMSMSRYHLSIMMWGYVDGQGNNIDPFLKDDDEDEDAFDDMMPPIRVPPLVLQQED